MNNNFDMEFESVLNGITYKIIRNYIYQIKDSKIVNKFHLTPHLLHELQKIKSKTYPNHVNRIFETTRALNVRY